MLAQQLSSFVEYGTTLHTGDNTPFGRSATSKDSLRSTTILTYVEEYPTNTNLENGSLKKHWIWFAAAIQHDLLHCTAGLRRHPLQVVWILCRKPGTEFSIAESRAEQWRHDLVGNARPIPQVQIGIPEYVQLLPCLGLKGEISYGWFTDNKYQQGASRRKILVHQEYQIPS